MSENISTHSRHPYEDLLEGTSYDPDRLFLEMLDMQRHEQSDPNQHNPRFASLAYELSGTLQKLLHPEPLPQEATDFAKELSRFYSRDFTESLLKYLDRIADAAHPFVEGLTKGFTGYLCAIDLTPGSHTEFHYTGRNDEFVYDAWALTSCLAEADNKPDADDYVMIRASTTRHAVHTCIDLDGPTLKTPSLPSPHELRKYIDKNNKLDRKGWRKKIVDMLAIVQRLIDAQNKSNWSLTAAEALTIPNTPENEGVIAYVNEHLAQANLKTFLRTDIFNKDRRDQIHAAVPKTAEAPQKSSSEEIADRMIARHLWQEIISYMSSTEGHDIREAEGHAGLHRRFERFLDTFLDTLGKSIGRGIGRKLYPINEAPLGKYRRSSPLSEHNRIVTSLDEPALDDSKLGNCITKYPNDPPKRSTDTFEEKMLPYLDIADSLVGILAQVRLLQRFLEPLRTYDHNVPLICDEILTRALRLTNTASERDTICDECPDSDFDLAIDTHDEHTPAVSVNKAQLTKPLSTTIDIVHASKRHSQSLKVQRKIAPPPVIKADDIAV